MTARPIQTSSKGMGSRFSKFSKPVFRSRGMTLVELMVAMAVGLVVVAATVGVLSVAQRGFTTVDASSQLRDNGRYITTFMTRLLLQAGYANASSAMRPRTNDATVSANPVPSIIGFNDAKISPSDPYNATGGAWGASPVGHGSDILFIRYQGGETTSETSSSGKSGSMITCSGDSPPDIPENRDKRIVSIFYVALSNNEPTLMCKFSFDDTIPPPSGGGQPLISGVESFQVLYGVAGVAPNTATAPNIPYRTDRYLRADQMSVPGDAIATYNNWRRVRSIRIGLVLRGPLNSVQDPRDVTVLPFGNTLGSAGGSVGSAFTSALDPGTSYQAGSDGRLRQVVTFTVHLRNLQDPV